MPSFEPEDDRDDTIELMRRCCEGDDSAFRLLHKRVAPPLRRYLLRMLRNNALADDVLQKTFLKVHKARRSFAPGVDPLPWLYRIAHRSALDELRRIRRARETWLSTERGACARATLSGSSEQALPHYPEGAVRAVLAALERLPTHQRSAVVLTKMHGKSTHEAAVALGTTRCAIKLRVHRGYIALRAMLEVDPWMTADGYACRARARAAAGRLPL
jgi:RNA polymerase sigma-70 factor, ECF subfamily